MYQLEVRVQQFLKRALQDVDDDDGLPAVQKAHVHLLDLNDEPAPIPPREDHRLPGKAGAELHVDGRLGDREYDVEAVHVRVPDGRVKDAGTSGARATFEHPPAAVGVRGGAPSADSDLVVSEPVKEVLQPGLAYNGQVLLVEEFDKGHESLLVFESRNRFESGVVHAAATSYKSLLVRKKSVRAR